MANAMFLKKKATPNTPAIIAWIRKLPLPGSMYNKKLCIRSSLIWFEELNLVKFHTLNGWSALYRCDVTFQQLCACTGGASKSKLMGSHRWHKQRNLYLSRCFLIR